MKILEKTINFFNHYSSDTSCALTWKGALCCQEVFFFYSWELITCPDNECHCINGQAKHIQAEEVYINSKVTELMGETYYSGTKGVPAQAGTMAPRSPTLMGKPTQLNAWWPTQHTYASGISIERHELGLLMWSS